MPVTVGPAAVVVVAVVTAVVPAAAEVIVPAAAEVVVPAAAEVVVPATEVVVPAAAEVDVLLVVAVAAHVADTHVVSPYVGELYAAPQVKLVPGFVEGAGPGPVVVKVVTEVETVPATVLVTVLEVAYVEGAVYVGFGGQWYGHGLPHVSVPLM